MDFAPAITPWPGRGAIGQWRRAVSIGEVLASARGQAGLTVTQVSQRTRIRETLIGGIERDDFSGCGGDFYARGHIRAIARAVGTDGEPLVGEYDSSHGTPQAPAAAGLPRPPAPLRLRPRRRPNWRGALLVALAAAASVVTYHLVASGHAGGAPAAARTPAVSVPKAARRHPAVANTPPPPAARPGSRAVVISLTAVSEACWADLATPGRGDGLRRHPRPGYLEDVDATAGSHPGAWQPGRGHADRGRQDPHRARAGPGHAETGTGHQKLRVARRGDGRLPGCLNRFLRDVREAYARVSSTPGH